ncbi:hypothetical protein KGF54_000164 [Candida jiufengensis]|uniref:uncharacterized protein n=1 Tax=Candida jiufengensis TaxID=497108 RepID=UPI0022242EFF|nr:uncharacterized protein KGF54_000164 [Candida jiufengensis]KAI5957236.1 hypothetical protein KGF54_000164 [Candida jiufengensis]
MPGLTNDQKEFFDKEGMLCIENFLTPEETNQLLEQSKLLLTKVDLSNHTKTTFKTADEDHIGDKYFFESADKTSFFFDIDAFTSNGELTVELSKAINKIGHGLHIQNPLFKKVTFSDSVKQIAKDLNYKDPKVLQSMCIFKQPISGDVKERDNAVPPHNDATFLFTNPQSAVGFWIALEDCTLENGCLSYIPGTHKTYPVSKRFVRTNGLQGGCKFEQLEDEKPVEGEYKHVPCKAGSLILIHNSVLHKSEKNKSDKSRYAYAFHIIDGVTEYDNKNWLQVPYEGGSEFSKLYKIEV